MLSGCQDREDLETHQGKNQFSFTQQGRKQGKCSPRAIWGVKGMEGVFAGQGARGASHLLASAIP